MVQKYHPAHKYLDKTLTPFPHTLSYYSETPNFCILNILYEKLREKSRYIKGACVYVCKSLSKSVQCLLLRI